MAELKMTIDTSEVEAKIAKTTLLLKDLAEVVKSLNDLGIKLSGNIDTTDFDAKVAASVRRGIEVGSISN